MIEHQWVVEGDRFDYMAQPNHWYDHREGYLVDQFVDGQLAADIIREWLECTGGDEDKLARVFDKLEVSERVKLAEEYIEFHGMESDFNAWYDEHFMH